jgi:hypothetical protein
MACSCKEIIALQTVIMDTSKAHQNAFLALLVIALLAILKQPAQDAIKDSS